MAFGARGDGLRSVDRRTPAMYREAVRASGWRHGLREQDQGLREEPGVLNRSGVFETGYTILVSSRIDILTAKPYVEELARRGLPLFVVCSRGIREAVRDHLPAAPLLGVGGEKVFVEDLSESTSAVRALHTLICILLEEDTPSRNIRKRFVRSLSPRSPKVRLALAGSRMFPKLGSPRLNRLLGRILRPFFRNPFPTRRILAVSHVTAPHLLCARNLEVVTLNESWDHAGGKCAGYPSSAVIAWNADVGRDWVVFQGAKKILTGYAVKLAYACASGVAPSSAGRTAMYALGTCATELDWYEEEMRLIEAVCEATREAGWELLLKPRPAGPQPGIEDFARRFSHVSIGRLSRVVGTRDYYLDDDYNESRLAELRRCAVVINSITTFGLDAACAGVPVLQLDLRESRTYRALSVAQQNYHLSQYLLGDGTCCLKPSPGSSVLPELAQFLEDPDQRAVHLRDRLRSWIGADEDGSRRVTEVVDELVDWVQSPAEFFCADANRAGLPS